MRRLIVFSLSIMMIIFMICIIKISNHHFIRYFTFKADSFKDEDSIEIHLKREGIHLVHHHNDVKISPDGRYIVFSGKLQKKESDEEAIYALLRVSLYNGKITVLRQSHYVLKMLNWAKNSEMILYKEDSDLYCMNMRSRFPLGWKVDDGVGFASFDPNSRRIAYDRNHEYEKGIWLKEIEERGKIQLTDGKQDAHPIWYPDEDKILFLKDLGSLFGKEGGMGQALYTYLLKDGQQTKHLSYYEMGSNLLPERYSELNWVVDGEVVHIMSNWNHQQREYLYHLNDKVLVQIGDYPSESKAVTYLPSSKNKLIHLWNNEVHIFDEDLNRILKKIKSEYVLLDVIFIEDDFYLFIEGVNHPGESELGEKVRIMCFNNGQLEMIEDFGYYSGFIYHERENHFVYFVSEEKNNGRSHDCDGKVLEITKIKMVQLEKFIR